MIPAGVQVQSSASAVSVKGPLGEIHERLPAGVSLEVAKEQISVLSSGGGAIHGTIRARVANAVKGVTQGFSRILEIQGVGFRAQVSADKLEIQLGFSHPVRFNIPKGIKVQVDPKQTLVTVSGPSRDLVGQVCSEIRSLKPVEPYKGSGIRYQGEHVVRKAGKTAAGVGAGAGGKK